jgi:AraC-like DNA-binding protein
MMDEGVRLGCPSAFQGVHADHLSVEGTGEVPVRTSRQVVLAFSVHGELVVHGERGETRLRPNEAVLVSGPPALRIRHAASADFYVLRFRHARLPRAVPRGRLEVPDHVTVLRPARLTHLLRRLIDEVRLPSPSGPVLHHLVVLALCELARSSVAEGTAIGTEGTAIGTEAGLESIASRVDAFVAAHYHEPIGTPDIARELHYNPDYLERAYHLERRMSIREAVHARRIKEARAQLILQRTKGVAEIGALCGYADAGYFRRVFKRATNMTPHGYRRLNPSPLRAPAAVAAGVQPATAGADP